MAGWIDGADDVFTSELTFLEARRAIAREEAAKADADRMAKIRETLTRVAARWWVLPISETVLRWAGDPFKREPVRSLDAIHLASMALLSYEPVGRNLVFLSLDKRVRVNAIADWLNLAPLATQAEDDAAEQRTVLGEAILARVIEPGGMDADNKPGIATDLLWRLQRGTLYPTADHAQHLARWLGWPVERILEAAATPAPDSSGDPR